MPQNPTRQVHALLGTVLLKRHTSKKDQTISFVEHFFLTPLLFLQVSQIHHTFGMLIHPYHHIQNSA